MTNTPLGRIIASMNKPKIYALAGELVSESSHARRILVEAIHKDKEWLIPRAESVLRQLRANGQ